MNFKILVLLKRVACCDISVFFYISIILLYLSAIKYNAEKEEAYLQDAKQKKLAAVEEAKKIEAEKRK